MHTVSPSKRHIEFKKNLIYSHSQVSLSSWISGVMLCSKDFTAPASIKICFWNEYLLSSRGSVRGSLSRRDQHCSGMPFLPLFHSRARGGCCQVCFQALSAPVSCCRIDTRHCKWFEMMLNTDCHLQKIKANRESRARNPGCEIQSLGKAFWWHHVKSPCK